MHSQFHTAVSFCLFPAKVELPDFELSFTQVGNFMQYFHPDNMSSAEKMKIELAKVRDEFKMSESDCGSARVQGISFDCNSFNHSSRQITFLTWKFLPHGISPAFTRGTNFPN